MSITTEEILAALPGPDRVGDVDHWRLPSNGDFVTAHARLLGVGPKPLSTQHTHPGHRYASKHDKCVACRWFEPRIFREVDGTHRYLLHRMMVSIVPGEPTRTRHEWIFNGHELVEALTTRHPDREPFISMPAARVLAQASGLDDELDDAWVNRATV